MSSPAAVHLSPTAHPPSAPLVVLAGWLVPGAGYWLIGQRARAVTVGVTIVALFLAGMLIGGVRAIQVPGYGEGGQRIRVWYEMHRDRPTNREFIGEEPPRGWDKAGRGPWVAGDVRGLLGEIGNKPWSICQVMAGPLALAGGAWSVQASRPIGQDDAAVPADSGSSRGTPASTAGVLSHSRINEIAVLYTAVAGMLNLLVMIDAAARADDLADATTGERSGAFNHFLRMLVRGLRGTGG
jgi:hypothetical protein